MCSNKGRLNPLYASGFFVLVRYSKPRMVYCIYGPRREKTFLRGFANNTGADQPAHSRSLISAFVIHFLESILYYLATGEILIFWLVPIAEENYLKLALSETPKTGFLATSPLYRGLML